METFRTLVREPATVPEQVDLHTSKMIFPAPAAARAGDAGITELEYEFYRRLVENSSHLSPAWRSVA